MERRPNPVNERRAAEKLLPTLYGRGFKGDAFVNEADVDAFLARVGQDGVRRVYTWDAENRLIRYGPVPGHEQAGDKKVEFQYDAAGRRVEKKVYNWTGGQWPATPVLHRKFVWGGTGGSPASGWLLLLELNGLNGDAVVRKYTWGLDLAGQGGASASGRSALEGAGGIGGLLAVLDTNGTPGNPGDDKPYVYFYNGNGDVGQVIDPLATTASGSIKVKFEYDPYGARVNFPLGGEFNQPFRFSTKYFDAESGLYNYGYRYYHPGLGRWISRDPIGEVDAYNLYVFVANRPTNAVDPVGLFLGGTHDKITRAAILGAGCNWNHVAKAVSRYNQRVDRWHPEDPKYHAQSVGFVNYIAGDLATLRRLDCCKNKSDITTMEMKLGEVLHILQDFYSHSDWIEGGKAMASVYEANGLPELVLETKDNPAHDGTLSLDELEKGSMQQLVNVLLYPGSGNPWQPSLHNLFAADLAGYGRSRQSPMGLGPAAFGRAVEYAERQSLEVIEWVKANMNRCCCAQLCGANCHGPQHPVSGGPKTQALGGTP